MDVPFDHPVILGDNLPQVKEDSGWEEAIGLSDESRPGAGENARKCIFASGRSSWSTHVAFEALAMKSSRCCSVAPMLPGRDGSRKRTPAPTGRIRAGWRPRSPGRRRSGTRRRSRPGGPWPCRPSPSSFAHPFRKSPHLPRSSSQNKRAPAAGRGAGARGIALGLADQLAVVVSHSSNYQLLQRKRKIRGTERPWIGDNGWRFCGLARAGGSSCRHDRPAYWMHHAF